jgi:hypothetical protein
MHGVGAFIAPGIFASVIGERCVFSKHKEKESFARLCGSSSSHTSVFVQLSFHARAVGLEALLLCVHTPGIFGLFLKHTYVRR